MKKFLIVLTLLLLLPIPTNAQELTYGQLQDDLAKAQKELDANKNAINNQNNAKNKTNATINSIKNELEDMSKEAVKLQQEIADANIEIEKKREQSKDVVAYLQMSQGDNVYLEYVFGGDTITDLVYRLSVVEQITEYNNEVVSKLENLIKANENRKVELANKEIEYEQKVEKLNNEISKINNSISKLGDLSPSLEQELKSKRELLNYYKSQGCKNRSDIIGIDCAVTSSNATFTRPLQKGYVTSFVGYRGGSLHRGIDLGSSLGKSTPLYSIGNGTVTSKWLDTEGAICINVEYRTTSGQYYTAIYAHLSSYASGIYVGKTVNSNTILGYMGDTGHAYGVHLHLEVWPCRYGSDSNCSNWNKYVAFTERKFNEGFRGAESVINFPKQKYSTWTTK